MTDFVQTELQLNEISCMKAVSGDSFVKGLQEYIFSIGRPNAWSAKDSYFQFKLKITANGNKPNYFNDKIAMSENVCANLYNNCYFRAGGQDVSSIVSYVPQASQIKMRLQTSLAHQQSMGKGAMMLEPSFSERSKMVSSGPYEMNGGNEVIGVGFGSTASMTTATITGVNTTFVDSGVKVGDVIIFTFKKV